MTFNISNASLVISNSDLSGDSDFIVGDHNALHLTNSYIVGDGNLVYCSDDTVMGNFNSVYAGYSTVSGNNNFISGYDETVLGSENLLYGDSAHVTGSFDHVNGNNEVVTGDFNVILYNAKELVPNNTSVQGAHNDITIGNSEHLSLGGDNDAVHVMGSAKIDLAAGNNSDTLDFRHILDSGKAAAVTVNTVNHSDQIWVANGDTFSVAYMIDGSGADVKISHAFGPTDDVFFAHASPGDINIMHHA